jgi:hypothetical protein
MAIAHLNICDECDLEILYAHSHHNESYERYEHAQLAFPGISFDEFIALDRQLRQPERKKGRQPQDPFLKMDEPKPRAVRDFFRLRDYWAMLHPENPRSRPPLAHEQIVATRHDIRGNDGVVDPEIVISAARRPKSRQWHEK